jgi:hypothetical protein
MIRHAALCLIALLLLPLPATAADRIFVNGEAVTLDAGEGYVLVRTHHFSLGMSGTFMPQPLLFRVLSDTEMAQVKALAQSDPRNWQDKVEPNIVEPFADKPYLLVGDEDYLLISLRPGTYILGGVAATSWGLPSIGAVRSSLCMGTVSFTVKPGVVTDMGAIFTARDDRPTGIPELANVVTGKPIGSEGTPDIVALVPGAAATDVPPTIAALPSRVPANYRAVGAMPNYVGAPLSRLSPVPGVLDYDKDGNAVDLKAKAPTP